MSLSLNSEKDSTSPAPIGECSTEGWRHEPLKFTSKKNLDVDIQLWAYRSASVLSGTAYSPVCVHTPI